MSYSVFNKKNVDALKENMFFGESVNVARYDQQRYPIFEQLTEKQMSFFWRPEEFDLSKDRIDYQGLTDAEKHIFVSNLKYQTLLDSVQGRSPTTVLLPLVSVPELEVWIETWGFYEAIHSRSYTHIIRNIVVEPGVIFDDIMVNDAILKRAESVSKYYDDLYDATVKYRANGESSGITLRDLKKKLYLCMVAVYALEAIRFYVSFACSFNYGERKLMEANAKIIATIARDEALHMSSTQNILSIWASGDDDLDMVWIAHECADEVKQIFIDVAEQEKEWASYLFKDGSMVGLNKDILCQYVEFITNQRVTAIGGEKLFEGANTNPIPWINNWLSSDALQVAPQETEIRNYLVGQIDSDLGEDAFDGFEL